ncbi:thiol peroxidase [Pseudocolwellia sp. HL-MZ19]|uniref:thiol peroxidase n=1 Tax=unclassified Pseudocolwellia TaxID=2848178 RepID=UPI003CF8058D
MTSLTFKGTEIQTKGAFPTIGESAPDFSLVTKELSEISLADLKGKRVIFNIFPSIDTPVCALQLKKFNGMVSSLENTVLLFSSLDLPFAFSRFCAAENIDNAITTSDYRHGSLAESYGVKMFGGPLDGLYARAVIILDEEHKVIYSELVSEVTDEPNYDAALAALK